MIDPPGPGAEKSVFRSWAADVRRGLDWEALSHDIVGHLARWKPLEMSSVALLFLPMAEEVNLNELPEALPGPRFVATRTPQEGPLTVHDLGGPLEVHRFGFLQPHASAPQVPVEDVDMFLLPGLAFDLHGTRLGRGAGYFDELLARARRGARRGGVVPAALVVDALPREPHDVSVGHLATEEGVVAVA